MSKQGLEDEDKFLSKEPIDSSIFPKSGPVTVSVASQKVMAFTQSYPPTQDPFMTNYPYANPWATKKDNKGKKDKPAGPSRPVVKGEVAL